MSSPSSRTRPLPMKRVPSTAFIALDLPAPFGPMRVTISDRPRVIETSWMTSAPP